MNDIDTRTAAALRDAFRRHVVHSAVAPSQTHDCAPVCATDTYERFKSKPQWPVERLEEAWLAHWESVRDWVWTADNVWDTDHRCADVCLADIASRL